MQNIRITVNHPVGLHARPAAQFVQTASKYESAVTVANITKDSAVINAKSILLVLTLGVHTGGPIRQNHSYSEYMEQPFLLKKNWINTFI